MAVSQKQIDHFLGKGKQTTSNVMTTPELNLSRKFRRIEKLANRIRRNKARPEELEEFEARKKALGVKDVWFNNYKKEWVIE